MLSPPEHGRGTVGDGSAPIVVVCDACRGKHAAREGESQLLGAAIRDALRVSGELFAQRYEHVRGKNVLQGQQVERRASVNGSQDTRRGRELALGTVIVEPS